MGPSATDRARMAEPDHVRVSCSLTQYDTASTIYRCASTQCRCASTIRPSEPAQNDPASARCSSASAQNDAASTRGCCASSRGTPDPTEIAEGGGLGRVVRGVTPGGPHHARVSSGRASLQQPRKRACGRSVDPGNRRDTARHGRQRMDRCVLWVVVASVDRGGTRAVGVTSHGVWDGAWMGLRTHLSPASTNDSA